MEAWENGHWTTNTFFVQIGQIVAGLRIWPKTITVFGPIILRNPAYQSLKAGAFLLEIQRSLIFANQFGQIFGRWL